ncbi:hypothetical protein Z949_39 [Sulfitobacter guttiformis KCTC 32187]|nr:hypothetical protein Z949_39 [Sulfitobacter guttiformis KCTC 32187]
MIGLTAQLAFWFKPIALRAAGGKQSHKAAQYGRKSKHSDRQTAVAFTP